jgi:hypothetical protein
VPGAKSRAAVVRRLARLSFCWRMGARHTARAPRPILIRPWRPYYYFWRGSGRRAGSANSFWRLTPSCGNTGVAAGGLSFGPVRVRRCLHLRLTGWRYRDRADTPWILLALVRRPGYATNGTFVVWNVGDTGWSGRRHRALNFDARRRTRKPPPPMAPLPLVSQPTLAHLAMLMRLRFSATACQNPGGRA